MADRMAALKGRLGGLATAATHDPQQYTAKARATFNERFAREVDPLGALPEGERQRRASAAKKAYFARLAFHSSIARARRKRTTRVDNQA